jgi:xanthine dehydrogenase iron-sulfur cluster and FAD-binding subunit A
MHAAGRRCPGRPAASYQPQPPRGSHGFHVRRSTNGTLHKVDVDGDTPLLWVLHDVLGMTGTKFGCGQALCGACTVHVDGAATRPCITTVDSIGESAISMLLAEDLEVELDQIQVQHAPANDALYANSILHIQTTGLSSSVRAFWTPLRQVAPSAATC